MEREGCSHEFSITDFIDDDASDNDAEAESGEACSSDQADLQSGEIKCLHPIAEDAPANAKPNASSQNGHKPGKEKTFCVGRDAVCFIHIR
ncbi:hypothetical protein Cflav_PD1435 [Pedosphaera parvula Ellin514]|uniref:Uncharacterized protein n=1 Tax=Pedosphaera parvula (strain Ellin514) TaxID=320771 RepID=B9XPK7_PEDPL|nr:hypothetical protein Cflav_PD1435 [Pedosphaera parvula Ellin514]